MMTIAPTASDNPGVVPPWLTAPSPITTYRGEHDNPGIVPPWLQHGQQPPVRGNAAVDTSFVRVPVEVSPPRLVG